MPHPPRQSIPPEVVPFIFRFLLVIIFTTIIEFAYCAEPKSLPLKISNHPSSPSVSTKADTVERLRAADELRGRERKQDALNLLNQWLKDFPHHPDAPHVYATIIEIETDLDKIIALTRRLIESYPDSPQAHAAYLRLGNAYFLKGNYSKALSAFSDFLRLNPTDPASHHAQLNLAHCLMKLAKYRDALAELNAFRHNFPDCADSPAVFDSIAECQSELGLTQDAARTLRYIISKFPNYPYIPKCYLYLGLLYEDRGQYHYAKEWYAELVRLFPDSVEHDLAQIRVKDIETTLPLVRKSVPGHLPKRK